MVFSFGKSDKRYYTPNYELELDSLDRKRENWLQDAKAEPRFARGYCLHEHVPEMDMIDMNGRLYDPTLCQFLSPDPYIQDPTNWQNYNRYAYCLQNPMLYTDPSGEKVAWWTAIATTILCPTPGTLNGLANVYCNKESGYIQHSSDMWKCYGQGFLVGSVMPIPVTSARTMYALPIYSVATTISWACHGFDNDILINSFKITAGASYIDGDTDFWKGVWYGMSDRTYCFQQESVGLEMFLMQNIRGDIDRVDYLDGAVFGTDENADVKGEDGMTIGKFSFVEINDKIEGNFNQYAISAHNGVYMHEYGHIYQSRNYGLAYIFYIGPRSIGSAAMHDGTHRYRWYEVEASYYGKRHFTQKYGNQIWTQDIEKKHPTK